MKVDWVIKQMIAICILVFAINAGLMSKNPDKLVESNC